MWLANRKMKPGTRKQYNIKASEEYLTHKSRYILEFIKNGLFNWII